MSRCFNEAAKSYHTIQESKQEFLLHKRVRAVSKYSMTSYHLSETQSHRNVKIFVPVQYTSRFFLESSYFFVKILTSGRPDFERHGASV